MGLDHVEFREGLMEDLPVEDGWADVVISNGAINLCADKKRIFSEIQRVLRLGGRIPSRVHSSPAFGIIAILLGDLAWRHVPFFVIRG